MKLPVLSFVSILLICIVFACKKDAENTRLLIKLTDAPASFEEVNVDLEEVNVKLDNDSASWVKLQTKPGIYNLLALQNGVDTLISDAVVPQGNVKEVRLVLGNQNSLKYGGEVYPLTIPSGSESGLKIKVNRQLRASIDSLVIDFDAALSVKSEDGGYKLRPVLRIK